MTYIQFAEKLAEQLGKIVVIVDMRKELAIVTTEARPVRAVHIGGIEALAFLALHIVKHEATLCRRIENHLGIVRNRLDGASEFIKAPAEKEYVFSIGRHIEVCRTFGVTLLHRQITAFKVKIPYEGALVGR